MMVRSQGLVGMRKVCSELLDGLKGDEVWKKRMISFSFHYFDQCQ